uniref:ATP-dependent Clp protease n=1 Tax=Babesia orientalis TaxID=273649 RepID=A0A0M4NGY0_9APIC|nr:ATP-dependent Clp protease [Babesia orientalis]ALE29347.1 ATP-dependent Clp protease [Babesia orientalis]
MNILTNFIFKSYLYYIYLITNKYMDVNVYKKFISMSTYTTNCYFINTDGIIDLLHSLNKNTVYMVHNLVIKFIEHINTANTVKTNNLLKSVFYKFNEVFSTELISINIVKIFDKIILIFNTYSDFVKTLENTNKFTNFINSCEYDNIVIFIKEINSNYKNSLNTVFKKYNLSYNVSIEDYIVYPVNNVQKTQLKNFKIKKFLNFYLYNNLTINITDTYIKSLLPYIQKINLTYKKKDLHSVHNYLNIYLKNNINLIEPVLKSINKAFYRSNTSKPLNNFLFCGPSGSGKTELAKILTYSIFKSLKYLIKLNMSEYMEAHSISKILGAPPGYVGYNEGNDFINKVKSLNKSVILFDEIEKAHKSINDLMLQILEEGKLTLANGDVLTFNNSFIIFTSNLGCDNTLTFKDCNIYKQTIFKSIKNFFKPEFLSRINNTLIFDPVSVGMCFNILDTILIKLNINKGYYFYNINNKLKEEFIKYSYNILYGLRPLYKINELLSVKISEHNNRFPNIIPTYMPGSSLLESLNIINFKYFYNSYNYNF